MRPASNGAEGGKADVSEGPGEPTSREDAATRAEAARALFAGLPLGAADDFRVRALRAGLSGKEGGWAIGGMDVTGEEGLVMLLFRGK